VRSSDSDGSTEPAMCHIEGPARPGGFELEAHPGSRPLKFHCGHWRHSQVDVTVAMCRASRSRLQCAKSEPSRHAYVRHVRSRCTCHWQCGMSATGVPDVSPGQYHSMVMAI
jgi:hypothetical protein